MRTFHPMSHRALLVALAALLGATACGSPPPPPADAAPDWSHGCAWTEARVADACVPVRDETCGAEGRTCPAGQECAITSGGDGGVSVRCVERW